MSQRNFTHNKSPCKGRVLRTLGRILLTFQHIEIRSDSADTRYRCTKRGPMPSLQGNLWWVFSSPINLTSVALLSQDRPLGNLAKHVSPSWPLRKTTLLLMPLSQLPPTGWHPACVWHREVSQKNDPTIPGVQQWWPQRVQNSPNQLFGSTLCSQSLLFHCGGTAVLVFFFFLQDYEEIAFTCY